jgi:hypothetical protein
MNQLVAIYRSPSYSPRDHRRNDAAILEATTVELAWRGWRVATAHETDVAAGHLPPADLYLNMCQGASASERLGELAGGARVVNRPASVINCHRRKLVESMMAAGVPFPFTLLAPTTPGTVATLPIDLLTTDHDPIWVKRGDVHAERVEDVVVTDRDGLEQALAAFARRGISWAALQTNVPGPIVKFYGVAGGEFFRWYRQDGGDESAVDESRLREVAFCAAAALGLEIFGGDFALPAPDQPVLIDINDWPSFARVREDAARAIAHYVHGSSLKGTAS